MGAADSVGTPDSLIVSTLSAVVASVVGVASLWFQEWRTRRTEEARWRRELDEARAYLTFLTEWFTARQAIAPDVDVGPARVWAAQVLDRQLNEVHAASRAAPERQRLRFWPLFRELLLLYPLRSVAGAVVRLVFYGFMAFGFGVLSSVVLDERETWGARAGASAMLLVVGGGVLYGVRRLALWSSPHARPPGRGEGGRASGGRGT